MFGLCFFILTYNLLYYYYRLQEICLPNHQATIIHQKDILIKSRNTKIIFHHATIHRIQATSTETEKRRHLYSGIITNLQVCIQCDSGAGQVQVTDHRISGQCGHVG